MNRWQLALFYALALLLAAGLGYAVPWALS